MELGEVVRRFYDNLKLVYTLHKYESHHIWKADKSNTQASKNRGTWVLSSKTTQHIHIQVLDERVHLSVLSCINTNGARIPNFYIFKSKQFLWKYIKGCELGACMAIHPSAWVTPFLFDKWLDH